jgi:uncharacterized protein YecE (DUF72 family)
MADEAILIGTAGWTIPRAEAGHFPEAGSSLERYAARFACAEINSSFHRAHRADTWARWVASVPGTFRFAAKLSKVITHEAKLDAGDADIAAAVDALRRLGDRLAVVLVQLPPSLAFEPGLAEAFFASLRRSWDGHVACEPRHPTWLGSEAESLLDRLRVARVAADPARAEGFEAPGGWRGLAYYRLHGSPVMYRSAYGEDRLRRYARALAEAAREGREAWCIFDNTASSAAVGDALLLQRLVGAP